LTFDIYQYYNCRQDCVNIPSMSNDPAIRYRQLQNTLAHVGYFRRGTLLKRFMACSKPRCACQASPPRLHGPYYQWTRKLEGKTVTVRLSAQQAELLAGWIESGRELERVIAEMESLSLQATERMLRKLPAPTTRKQATRAKRKRKG